MKHIILESINKTACRMEYRFQYSDTLQTYFSQKTFWIEYEENIENVPDAIAAIPLVCNVLPIVWLTDAELTVPSLDKNFYDCIDRIKAGFINMYPEVKFDGRVNAERIEKIEPSNTDRYESAVFFSGGVDATTTVIRHIQEKPLLITLWGSDVREDNVTGWEKKYKVISTASNHYHLPICSVRTSFREFDAEGQLEKEFSKILGKGYWYGLKHGIGIISHAAPLAWLYGIRKIYFASSNCPEDGAKVKCASDPRIDNQVRFCKAQVYHDGFELNRQKKVRTIVEFRRENPDIPIHLHVCWESSQGSNCCKCEKCYRTMAELWIEGEDPKDYGFDYPSDVFREMYRKIALTCNDMAKNTWTYGKERLIENWEAIREKDYARKIKWIKTFDFHHLEQNRNREIYQTCRKIRKIPAKIFHKMQNKAYIHKNI